MGKWLLFFPYQFNQQKKKKKEKNKQTIKETAMSSKVLKPSRLDLNSNSPTAAKEWKHWKRTFDNFITECGTGAPDKFRSIINFVFHSVFEYVEECLTYEQVVETLEKLYVKTPNEIFSRQLLATNKILVSHWTISWKN